MKLEEEHSFHGANFDPWKIQCSMIYQEALPSCSGEDSDELPELHIRDRNKKTDRASTSSEQVNLVNQLKQSDKALNQIPNPSPNKDSRGTIRRDFLSDDSGSEEDILLSLKSTLNRKSNQLNTEESNLGPGTKIIGVCDDATDKVSAEISVKPQGLEKSEMRQVINVKANKGKKRTAEEIEESRKTAMLLKEENKRRKEEEKLRKQQEREQKKREQEFEKQKKKTLMEARKQAKPGECLKFMTVVLSPGILKESSGAAILDALQKADIKYDIQPQIHDNILTLWREVSEVKEVAPMKLQSVTSEKVEDCVLMILPVTNFITLVYNYKQKQLGLSSEEDLHEHISLIKGSLEGRDVTVIVQGLDKYFRLQKTKENRAFKKQVQGSETGAKKSKKVQEEKTVSRLDVEEALVHLQLFDGCNIRFIEDDQDIAKTVKQYVKSVAETPFKRDRLQTGFTFHLDSSRSATVDRDGVGLTNAWRLQLQQFPLVTAEVANTVMATYSSPQALMAAYKKCDSSKQAERLLENLEVRRGAGVMATSRRIGKELSRRLYQFYTCADPDFVIP